MKIRKAIRLAGEGKSIRRRAWHSQSQVIVDDDEVIFYAFGERMDADFLVSDLLAYDWEVSDV